MGGRRAPGPPHLALCLLSFGTAAARPLRAPCVFLGHLQGSERKGRRGESSGLWPHGDLPDHDVRAQLGPSGSYGSCSALPREGPRWASTSVMLFKTRCRASTWSSRVSAARWPPLRRDSCGRSRLLSGAGRWSPALHLPLLSPTHQFLDIHFEGRDGSLLLRVLFCELLHQQRLLRESGEESGVGGRGCQSREQSPEHTWARRCPGGVQIPPVLWPPLSEWALVPCPIRRFSSALEPSVAPTVSGAKCRMRVQHSRPSP